MKTRTLGQGLEVSAIGLGCMGMSHAFPPIPEKAEIEASLPPEVGERYPPSNQAAIDR